MHLHEQYETLLRRGMPEHPVLHPGFIKDGGPDFWYMGKPCSLSVAHDLITMHALRWVLNRHSDVMLHYEWQPCGLPPHCLFVEIGGSDRGKGICMGVSALDAIIAATEREIEGIL